MCVLYVYRQNIWLCKDDVQFFMRMRSITDYVQNIRQNNKAHLAKYQEFHNLDMGAQNALPTNVLMVYTCAGISNHCGKCSRESSFRDVPKGQVNVY